MISNAALVNKFDYNTYHVSGGATTNVFYYPGPCCSKLDFNGWQAKSNDLNGNVDTDTAWTPQKSSITSSSYVYQKKNIVITVAVSTDFAVSRVEVEYNGEIKADYDSPYVLTFTAVKGLTTYKATVYDIDRRNLLQSYSVTEEPPIDTATATTESQNIATEDEGGSSVPVVGIAVGIIVAVVVLIAAVVVVLLIKKKKIFNNKSWGY